VKPGTAKQQQTFLWKKLILAGAMLPWMVQTAIIRPVANVEARTWNVFVSVHVEGVGDSSLGGFHFFQN